jgi:hypothetical protein
MQGYLGTPQTRTDSTTGIFPTQAPDQTTMPYLVISQVSGAPLQESMQGTGVLTGERWRFDCCGTTYKGAKKFGKYVRQFMLGLNGSQTAGNCFIQGVWHKMEADESESLGKGTMFHTHHDFLINYQDFDS